MPNNFILIDVRRPLKTNHKLTRKNNVSVPGQVRIQKIKIKIQRVLKTPILEIALTKI